MYLVWYRAVKVVLTSLFRQRATSPVENGLNFQIEVDGGVTAENIVRVKNAGTDIIVAGTAVFKNDDIAEATTKLKNLIM